MVAWPLAFVVTLVVLPLRVTDMVLLANGLPFESYKVTTKFLLVFATVVKALALIAVSVG